MNYNIIGNKLIVNEIPIEFPAPIDKAELFNNLLIVMLKWQNGNPFDFTNALYAVSEKGTILWQMQNVREFLPPVGTISSLSRCIDIRRKHLRF